MTHSVLDPGNSIKTSSLEARRSRDLQDQYFLYSLGHLAMDPATVPDVFANGNRMAAAAARAVNVARLVAEYPETVTMDGICTTPNAIGSDAAYEVRQILRGPALHEGL